MANDSDWVADVRRWYFSSQQARAAVPVAKNGDDSGDLGYEAAQPALQSRQWPDAPGTIVADLK